MNFNFTIEALSADNVGELFFVGDTDEHIRSQTHIYFSVCVDVTFDNTVFI